MQPIGHLAHAVAEIVDLEGEQSLQVAYSAGLENSPMVVVAVAGLLLVPLVLLGSTLESRSFELPRPE